MAVKGICAFINMLVQSCNAKKPHKWAKIYTFPYYCITIYRCKSYVTADLWCHHVKSLLNVFATELFLPP